MSSLELSQSTSSLLLLGTKFDQLQACNGYLDTVMPPPLLVLAQPREAPSLLPPARFAATYLSSAKPPVSVFGVLMLDT